MHARVGNKPQPAKLGLQLQGSGLQPVGLAAGRAAAAAAAARRRARSPWQPSPRPRPAAPPDAAAAPSPRPRRPRTPAPKVTDDWAALEIKPREGVRQMGMPTMEGEEDEDTPAGVSFRVPKGVTRKG
mgnify:CR=1 FL=1